MPDIIIVDNDQITIKYLPESGIIHHVIHKPISGQPFRDALNTATEFLREHGVTKWLSDDRKNGPLPQEDIEWGFNDWNRRAVSYGWKYWALVVPEDIYAAGSLMPTIENLYTMGLRMQVFTKPEDAFNWLNQMK